MTTRIKASERGPFIVHGEVELIDERGQPIDVSNRKKVLLCRCGESSSAPLCDGSHNRK